MTSEAYSSKTVGGRLITMDEHMHGQQWCYPTLADGVTVTGAAGAWALGAITEVIPADTKTLPYDIHYINVEAASPAADVFEIVLYSGAVASEVEVGRIRFTKSSAVDTQSGLPFQMDIVPGNTRLSAAMASASGGSDTITISVEGHDY